MDNLKKHLNELTAKEFDSLDAKYPEEKALLSNLRSIVLVGLARHCSDLTALNDFVDSIQDEGGNLDVSGYVYSELYNFQDNLRKCIRVTLRKGKSLDALPPISLKLKPTGVVRKGPLPQKKGESTKLGGIPDWIQGESTPICTDCKRAMTFVAQIDSIGVSETTLGRSLAKTKAFVFADCGMIYVFWCKGCNDTRALLQSY